MSDRRERIDDLPMAMMGVLEQFQSTLWTAMPAVITKITQLSSRVTVDCQPALRCKFNRADGSFDWVDMPVMTDMPVVFPSGGGFILTFPLKIGDEVLAVFANRCIDAWWQNGGVQNQIEFRMHDLSDGFALPGPRSQTKLPATINGNNVQLRNDAGDTYISIAPNKTIEVKTPQRVNVLAADATVEATNSVSINAPTIYLLGDVVIAGDVLSHNGKNVGDDHKHSGVATGGSNTGNPV